MNNEKQAHCQIDLEDMKAEIVREIKVRQRVYPQWIENGKISKQTADYRVLVLEAVALNLEQQIKKYKPQKNLFEF